jgi:hypothetical protein
MIEPNFVLIVKESRRELLIADEACFPSCLLFHRSWRPFQAWRGLSVNSTLGFFLTSRLVEASKLIAREDFETKMLEIEIKGLEVEHGFVMFCLLLLLLLFA